MELYDIQELTWKAINNDVPCNRDAAFYHEWLNRKASYTGPLGLPVTAEFTVTEGGQAQGFSTGIVLWWDGKAIHQL